MSTNRKLTYIIIGSITVGLFTAEIIAFAVGEISTIRLILGAATMLLILVMLIINYKGENQV